MAIAFPGKVGFGLRSEARHLLILVFEALFVPKTGVASFEDSDVRDNVAGVSCLYVSPVSQPSSFRSL